MQPIPEPTASLYWPAMDFCCCVVKDVSAAQCTQPGLDMLFDVSRLHNSLAALNPLRGYLCAKLFG